MDVGIQLATRTVPTTPLPPSWLGRADAPPSAPDWASIAQLSAVQQRSLLAQIAYVSSAWDYKKIGVNNQLGRYQVNTETLETYGLLTAGSNISYGTDCVNYQHCWRAPASTYAEYLTEVTNVTEFLNNSSAQELLSYQRLLDLYNNCIRIGVARTTDTADMIAGILYVAWQLGVGTPPSVDNSTGTGAYAWRYFGVGAGNSYYAAGRYAVVVLSK